MASQTSINDDETVVDHPITEALGFTEREKQVFELLLRGKDDASIARDLGISQATVKNRCRNIMQKLSASNRRDLIASAEQWDLAVARLTGEASHP
jgi:DNA-binding NarL/FixJ family response regulator